MIARQGLDRERETDIHVNGTLFEQHDDGGRREKRLEGGRGTRRNVRSDGKTTTCYMKQFAITLGSLP